MAYSKSEKKTHAGPNQTPSQNAAKEKKRKADYIARQKKASLPQDLNSQLERTAARMTKKTKPATRQQLKESKGRQASEKNPVYVKNRKNKK